MVCVSFLFATVRCRCSDRVRFRNKLSERRSTISIQIVGITSDRCQSQNYFTPISRLFAYMCTCLEQTKLRIRKLHQVVDRSTFIDRNIPLESVKSSFESSPVRFDLCPSFIKRSIRIFVVLETVLQSLVIRF